MSSLQSAAATSSLKLLESMLEEQGRQTQLQENEAQMTEPDMGFFQLPDGRRVVEDPNNPGKWTAVARDADPLISAAAAAAIAAAQQGCIESVILDPGPAQRMEGVVAEWNGSPGYGFVHFSDGRRAYVHSSQCSGTALLKGQAVTAEIVEDPKNPGKWQAVNVERLHSLSTTATGRMEGIVAEWTGNPGYGFIHFSDGRRAYVHNSQCGGSALAKGQAVSGLIAEDPKNPGKWQAQSVVTTSPGSPIPGITGISGLTGTSGVLGAAGGRGRHGAHFLLGTMFDHAADDCPGCPPAGLVGGAVPGPVAERHEGVVTQWNEKGFGFIQFSDGRFAYVHNSSCGGQHLSPGETVTAVIVEDTKNPGKLAAQEVQRQVFSEDGVVVPTVDWSGEQGFGFMQMDDGRRVYVHRSALGGIENLLVGLKLRVTTQQDARNPGKWCVAELLGSPGQDGAVPDPIAISQEPPVVGERCTGTVAEWDGKGVGVVLMEDGRQAEVYDSSPLEPGQIISAVLSPDPQIPGKLVAQGLETGPYLGDEGVVTEWHENQGYGFMQLDDSRKLYIHRSAFGGVGGLAVGSRIRVTTKPDIRNPGKWMAGQVVSGDGTALGSTTPRPARTSARAVSGQVGPGDRGGIGGSGINPVSASRASSTLGGLLGGSSPAGLSRGPGAGTAGAVAGTVLSELMAAASAAAAEIAEPAAKRARTTPPAVQFPMI